MRLRSWRRCCKYRLCVTTATARRNEGAGKDGKMGQRREMELFCPLDITQQMLAIGEEQSIYYNFSVNQRAYDII
jgi:hypothetical protein